MTPWSMRQAWPWMLLCALGCGSATPDQEARSVPPPAEVGPSAMASAAPQRAAGDLRAPKAAAAPPATEGEALYTRYCLPCHGADGRGNGGLAASFVDTPRIFAQSDAELLATVREGKQGDIGLMPPWKGTLSDEQIRTVLQHVRRTYGPGAPR